MAVSSVMPRSVGIILRGGMYNGFVGVGVGWYAGLLGAVCITVRDGVSSSYE